MFREVVLFTVLTHSLLKAFVLGQFSVFTRVNCKIDYCIQGNIHPFRPRCHRANSISQIISPLTQLHLDEFKTGGGNRLQL